jgi:hypothetical protein
MSVLKNYLTQVSTYTGLVKLGVAAGMLSTGVGGAIQAAILAVAGVVDVVRNENK